MGNSQAVTPRLSLCLLLPLRALLWEAAVAPGAPGLGEGEQRRFVSINLGCTGLRQPSSSIPLLSPAS